MKLFKHLNKIYDQIDLTGTSRNSPVEILERIFNDEEQDGENECSSCFDDVEDEHMLTIPGCNHSFCYRCVRSHVCINLIIMHPTGGLQMLEV